MVLYVLGARPWVSCTSCAGQLHVACCNPALDHLESFCNASFFAQEIDYAFRVSSSKLYISLKSKTLQQFDKAPYLRQFYLRLDFNGWVEAHNFAHLKVMKADRVDKQQQQ